MKKLLLTLFFSFVLVAQVAAQRVHRDHPVEDNNFITWTQLDSAGTVTKNFYFNPEGKTHGYGGFATVFVYADTTTFTTTQTTATYDSLRVVAYALDYDEISTQFEQCGECTVDEDSVSVLNWVAWGGGLNTDSTFLGAKAVNFMPCSGVRVVANAQSDLMIRIELQHVKW